jgi:hypothetical protein
MQIKIQEVTNADLAFGGDMSKLLPEFASIPEEFRDGKTKWNKVVTDWFYRGLKKCEWKPKEGIETQKALRHLKAVMASWEPKHEHKEAGCAYLLSEFFEDVKYEVSK